MIYMDEMLTKSMMDPRFLLGGGVKHEPLASSSSSSFLFIYLFF